MAGQMAKYNQLGFSLIETVAAIIVFGIGILLFSKMQDMMSKTSKSNANIMLAGQLIDKHMENIRIDISADTNTNWPPASDVIAVENGITLLRLVSNAISPKDGLLLARVRKVDIITSWGPIPRTFKDTLRISTYVSKGY
jgi:prepilin-type N-terminal cleavage/methylation domain-containing protein